MEPWINLQELTKVFSIGGVPGQELFSTTARAVNSAHEKVAVAGVNLNIRHGDRIGIVGRNGAGKSTLLHMIAGLSSPSSGSIDIKGKVTSVMTLGVGLRDQLSGRENIYIDGEMQGKAREEVDQVIDQIIAFADLAEFIDYPVRTYSTGMKARLAFSMISYIDPEILIIDEALSVGDAAFSAKATRRIREICDRGKIVIIVSHSMQAIQEICNRCIWMDNGRVIMDGAPGEVTKSYIESVRSADEAELMERFRKLIGSRSLREGWVIDEVAVYNREFGERRTLLEAEQPTRIEIRATAPPDEPEARLRVRITRLDELLLFDEYFPLHAVRLEDQSIGLEIEMQSLALGAAVYRIDVFLELAGNVFADNSGIFEVCCLNPPTGGKPMLLYPMSVSVLPTK